MKFENTLIVFDTETTGTNVQKDRIVELCMVKYEPVDGILQLVDKRTRLINPEMAIPAGASEVHHITDEMVKDQPTFKQLAAAIHFFIGDADLAGYNSNRFDMPLLMQEFIRAGISWDVSKKRLFDACNIYKRDNERTLSAAVKHYLKREHDGAHSAEADVIATAEILFKQIEEHDFQNPEQLELYANMDKKRLDISGLFTLNSDGRICYAIGKHAGKLAQDERDYLNWVINKSDFPIDTKKIAESIFYTFAHH
jgi:DNA polymerase III subunit epsilon